MRVKFTFQKGELKEYLESFERNYLLMALDRFHWDYELTARNTGMSRANIYRKSKLYGFEEIEKITIRKRS
jgi:DNA-binding NtrC family response regulator